MATVLDDVTIQRWISEHTGWGRTGDLIEKTYDLPTFMGSLDFVRQVADLAEAANHHPDIDIRYNRVRIGLSTHDAGGITAKDTALAEEIDGIAVGAP